MIQVELRATQGASLWETTGDTTLTPKGGKKITADCIEGLTAYSAEDKVLVDTIPDLTDSIAAKQDTLESGVTLKTINSESLLGAGDIVISGGSGGSADEITVTPTGNIISEDVQSALEELDGFIGDTSTLETTATDLVGAVNEVKESVSGGVKSRLYVPKGTPTAYDDEFDNGSIDGWTSIEVSGHENEWYEPTGLKGLSCYVPNGKGTFKLCGKLKSIGSLSPPFYIETAVRLNSREYGYPCAGLVFSDGVTQGSGKQIFTSIHSYIKAFDLQIYTGFTSRDSTNEINTQPYGRQDYMHIRLAYVSANTFSCYFSPDGVVWYAGFENISYSLTPTYMGIAENSPDNDTYPFLVNYGYFRARSGSPTNG